MDDEIDFRDIWLGLSDEDRRGLAKAVGSSYKYLQKLSGGFGMPSMALADKLKDVLPGMSMTGFRRAAAGAGRRMYG